MDKHRLKVGNGSSRWAELPFCPVIINDLVTCGVDAALSATQGKVMNDKITDMKSTVYGLGIFGMGLYYEIASIVAASLLR